MFSDRKVGEAVLETCSSGRETDTLFEIHQRGAGGSVSEGSRLDFPSGPGLGVLEWSSSAGSLLSREAAWGSLPLRPPLPCTEIQTNLPVRSGGRPGNCGVSVWCVCQSDGPRTWFRDWVEVKWELEGTRLRQNHVGRSLLTLLQASRRQGGRGEAVCGEPWVGWGLFVVGEGGVLWGLSFLFWSLHLVVSPHWLVRTYGYFEARPLMGLCVFSQGVTGALSPCLCSIMLA